MDPILTELLAFPPHPTPTPPLTDGEYDRQARSHLQLLEKLPVSKLAVKVVGGSDVIDILNPAINSLSFLHVLLARISLRGGKQKSRAISEAFTPGLPLWQKLLDFMDQFDPIQIRYSGRELRQLVEMTAQTATTVQQPAAAIAPIRSAMLRVDPTCSTFTSSHLILAQLCLTSRAFAAALPVLDKDIFHFPATSSRMVEATADSRYPYLCSNHESSSTYISTISGLTGKIEYQHHLKYYLYGAMCYMGLKDWDRAVLFCEVVLTSPTSNTTSKIQVDAYKKWVLVNLLHRGRMPSLPKITTSQAGKIYQNLGKEYTGLAEIFQEGIEKERNIAQLVAEVQAAKPTLVDDCNFGLALQVIDAYRQFSVQRLQKTYAALTVAEVTRRTSENPTAYANTGQYIIKLISTGQLNATISRPSEDPASWIVRFCNPSEKGPQVRSEEQQLEDLMRLVGNVKALTVHIKEADRKYGLSKEYLQETKRVRKFKEISNELDGGNSWNTPGDPFDHDEDVMADM